MEQFMVHRLMWLIVRTLPNQVLNKVIQEICY